MKKSSRWHKLENKFSYFHYFKKYNLISFKSPTDPITQKDFSDAIIYLNGFIGLEKDATLSNTTITLIVNHKPIKYLKNNKKFIKEITLGHSVIDFNQFNLQIIDLTSIEFNGIDGKFLLNFAPENKLGIFKDFFTNSSNKDEKLVANLKNLLYTRLNSFDINLKFKDLIMPTLAEADITHLVEPYYKKGVEQGIEQGIEKGIEKGIEQKGIEDARKMLAKGYEIQDIIDITGLSATEIIKLKKEL